MKYDRLIRLTKLIDYIASSPGKNYEFYADKFNVSTRTVRRDVETIAEAGLPIETSAGIRFINNIHLPEIDFTYNQALVLIIALSEFNRYIKLGGAFKEVKNQISRILPSKLLKEMEKIQSRIGIYPSTNNLAFRVSDKLSPLISCVIENRQIKIKYKSYSSQKIRWRQVDPYGLFFRRRDWYLVAFCHYRSAIRTFRFSRILEWQHLKEYFDYPSDFSLEDYVTDSWELMKGEPVNIKLKFSSEVSDLIMEANFSKNESKTILEDGSVFYQLQTGSWKEVYFWILSFGSDVEVIKPEWLKERIKQEVEEMRQIYNRRR